MHSRFVPASLALWAVLLTCQALLAASCLVDPDDRTKGATILDHGKEQVLSATTMLPDCSQLAVRRGMIHVLFDGRDGVAKHKTCQDSDTLCSVDAGTGTSFLETLRKLVTYHTVVGGKKMDKAVARLPGIPYGRVLSLERAATFNLTKAGLTQWNLTVLDAGSNQPLYRQAGSTPMHQIPRNLLRPGGKYTVVIDGGPQKYKGGFDLLGGAEAADIAGQIRQATTNVGATARAKKLDELIIYYENNLDYEMEVLREELGL